MKQLVTTLILALFISFSSYSQQGSKNFIDQPFIEVSGKVETEVIPNEIYLKITLDENDKKGKLNIEKQENQMLSALRLLNINIEKDLTIVDFDGYYKRKFLADNKVIKVKNYQLLINDGETLGKVYHSLDKIDISNISITKVSHTDIETFKRSTKLKALKVAKLKAQDYANTINQSIGKAIFIQEFPNYNYTGNGLAGSANGIMIRGYSSISSKGEVQKIQNLQINKIILSETVLAKFILK